MTHAHDLSVRACITYIHIARELLQGTQLREAISKHASEMPESDLEAVWEKDETDISSTGYVVTTLQAALWGLSTTTSYHDCILKLIALGADTDTIADVAGGLAGILYTSDGFPDDWVRKLRGKEVVESCLFETEVLSN